MFPDLRQLDPFEFFRLTVGWIATIYATVITVQSLWQWVGTLSGQEKYIGMIRRYLLIHVLRLRFKTFWGDVLICVLLCVVFFLLWKAHGVVVRMW